MKAFFLRAVNCAAFLLMTTGAHAQFQTAYIGVNGLTCSQCSRTVEMRVRKLDFVSDVQMNLQHTEGTIVLKKDKPADIEKIAQAVVDAGFSVRYLQADLNLGSSVSLSGNCISYKGDQYVLTHPLKDRAAGTLKLKFLGKKYQPKNEFRRSEAAMVNKCSNAAGKVYYVTTQP